MPAPKINTGLRSKNGKSAPADADDVLTLPEAAAYLRITEEEVLEMVDTQDLAARRIGEQWRFLKSALQDWLRSPLPRPSKQALQAVIGSWQDDQELDEMLKEIYRKRGRPMTEGAS